MSPVAAPPISLTTAASEAFVAAHVARATALGESLAMLVGRPDEFAAAIEVGFRDLSDSTYAAGVHRVTPGLGEIVGVRLPLMEVAHKAFKRGTRRNPTSPLLDVVGRLLDNRYADIRWFGMWDFERLLPTDPERTWQLMRRAAREAEEWITVDTLAHPYGAGILREPRRWAELEQLVYSPSRWERRLVGSTLATMPHVNFPGGRDRLVVRRGLVLIGQLIGDSEPDVQKALSWALRTFADIDRVATTAFIDAEALTASRTHDGHRAWVIRDCLSKLLPDDAERLRQILDGIRRRAGSPSTSNAAAAAVALLGPGSGLGATQATGRNSAP